MGLKVSGVWMTERDTQRHTDLGGTKVSGTTRGVFEELGVLEGQGHPPR